ncbi:MAG: leucine-rich repeat domain-containing protein [Prevotellaceae bacterium]|jgi:hypothetical protein|nr:leucine-rich repeat domain-containing protein [Prevotellaceae bacterium]
MKKLYQKNAGIFFTGILTAIAVCFTAAAGAQKEPEKPVEIRTVEDMLAIQAKSTSSYILMNDLVLDNWKPIGPFHGIFDGNGHSINISIDIAFSKKDKDVHTGLFSETGGSSLKARGIVKNLRVTGSIRCESPYREVYVGGIAGLNRDGIISNCVSEVDITVNAVELNVGGIVGYNRIPTLSIMYGSTIENCYSTGNIEAKGEKTANVGGIAGCSKANIKRCYTMGSVSVHESKKRCAGHIAGFVREAVVTAGSNPVSVGGRAGNIGFQQSQPVYLRDVISNVALGSSCFLVSGEEKHYTENIIGCNGENSDNDPDYYARRKNYLTVREDDGDMQSNAALFSDTQDRSWWESSAGFLFSNAKTPAWVWNRSLNRPTLYWEKINFENGESVIDGRETVPEDTKNPKDTKDTKGLIGNAEWEINDGTLTVRGSGNIPDGTHWKDHVITSVIIGDSITGIGSSNFQNQKNLASVTIGASVESLGMLAFSMCRKLVAVKVKRAEPPKMRGMSEAFMYVPVSKAQLTVPTGAKAAYSEDKRWKKFGEIVEENFEL